MKRVADPETAIERKRLVGDGSTQLASMKFLQHWNTLISLLLSASLMATGLALNLNRETAANEAKKVYRQLRANIRHEWRRCKMSETAKLAMSPTTLCCEFASSRAGKI